MKLAKVIFSRLILNLFHLLNWKIKNILQPEYNFHSKSVITSLRSGLTIIDLIQITWKVVRLYCWYSLFILFTSSPFTPSIHGHLFIFRGIWRGLFLNICNNNLQSLRIIYSTHIGLPQLAVLWDIPYNVHWWKIYYLCFKGLSLSGIFPLCIIIGNTTK